eukprot:973918-Pleurochrysis_carterae.AAC.5
MQQLLDGRGGKCWQTAFVIARGRSLYDSVPSSDACHPASAQAPPLRPFSFAMTIPASDRIGDVSLHIPSLLIRNNISSSSLLESSHLCMPSRVQIDMIRRATTLVILASLAASFIDVAVQTRQLCINGTVAASAAARPASDGGAAAHSIRPYDMHADAVQDVPWHHECASSALQP